MSAIARAAGVVAASRRRGGGAPTVLGYDTKGSAPSASALANGRLYVSKFTLASAKTLNELHCWLSGASAVGCQVRGVIYKADGAGGNPSTRVAYTSIYTWSGPSDYHLQEAGFSVALPAADYWIGFSCITTGSSGGSGCYGETSGGTHIGKTVGASDPPDNPFGSNDTSGTRKHSCWAIVT